MTSKTKTKTKTKTKRNWLLVVVASMFILFNIGLLIVAILNIKYFGWWSLGLAAAASSSIYFSIVAIKSNNPAWLMLDLIIPG